MENLENIQMELALLEKNPQTTAISQCLDDYLTHVAKTGNALFAWAKVKPLFKRKLELVIQEFHESSPTENLARQPNVDVFQFDQMKERIFEQLESYNGIPFTVQRLCELIVQPKRHYKRTDKFMRGLEKIMLVVSTIDPNPNSKEKQEPSDSNSYESPSKRMRISSIEDEPGPCDSADENTAAVAVEVVPDIDVAGPSSKVDSVVSVTVTGEVSNGHSEEADENMDIDSECTSSQARLSVTDNTAQAEDTGVESSESAEAGAAPGGDHDDTETMETDSDTTPVGDNVESSSNAVSQVTSDNVASVPSDGVSTSEGQVNTVQIEEAGAASSSDNTEHAQTPCHDDTNSEAEPAPAANDIVSDERLEEPANDNETVDDSTANVDNTSNQVENVQSSEDTSTSESEATPAAVTDSTDNGAADSSDQANVVTPDQAQVPATDSQDSQPSTSDTETSSSMDTASEVVTETNTDTVSDTTSQQEQDTSPDQSDTSVQ